MATLPRSWRLCRGAGDSAAELVATWRAGASDRTRGSAGGSDIGFRTKDFFAALQKAIAERGPEWQQVHMYNGRDGSIRKDANGKDIKGMLYTNLTFKDATKAPWNAQFHQGLLSKNLRGID